MTREERTEIAEQAARAARQAAEEASTPEARFFLRRHADRLAKLAAAERRPDVVAIAAPLLYLSPL